MRRLTGAIICRDRPEGNGSHFRLFGWVAALLYSAGGRVCGQVIHVSSRSFMKHLKSSFS